MSSGRAFREFEPERLVKSTDRVRDLGEVFTPAKTVDYMLDLLPEEIWQVHPSATFFEPSVGSGNFVSAILSRKLTLVDEAFAAGVLDAGNNKAAVEFHALEALSAIYGVDISAENIIGGTPGHEVACRPRLLEIMRRWHSAAFPGGPTEDSLFLLSARWIVDHNFIIGNMLERDGNGRLTDRDSIPLVQYQWDPSTLKVELLKTSFGDVRLEASGGSGDLLSLFEPNPPTPIWSGSFQEISSVRYHAQVEFSEKFVSNSRSKG